MGRHAATCLASPAPWLGAPYAIRHLTVALVPRVDRQDADGRERIPDAGKVVWRTMMASWS